MEKMNEVLNTLEHFKEIPRLQYDYFKHLSTISTASIGAVMAFVVKLFSSSAIEILAGLSVVSFLICIFYCLSGMTEPANMIIYMSSIHSTALSEEGAPSLIKGLVELEDKIKSRGRIMTKAYHVTRYSFLLGIIFVLAYATVVVIKK